MPGAQQKDALATQGRQQAEPQGILALIQSLAKGGKEPWQALMNGGHEQYSGLKAA
jgi:hypothetical protein